MADQNVTLNFVQTKYFTKYYDDTATAGSWAGVGLVN
jgi:hypothetical protein